MPRDLFLRAINLDHYYPPFLEKLLAVKAACAARGARYISTEGFRSWGASHQLYQKYLEGGPRAAPAGLSAHNYGLGDDCALIVQEAPKRVVRWGERDFEILDEECRKYGLYHGLKDDKPHVSWPSYEGRIALDPLVKIWTANKDLLLLPRLRKVWDYIDAADKVKQS